MRVALIHIGRGMDGTPASPVVDHLGLAMLAGSLEAVGHEVTIYDTLLQSAEDAEIVPLLEQGRPNLIGFTLNYTNIEAAVAVAEECNRRWPNVPIVAGGYYATFHCETLLAPRSPFSAVILGEGEVPLVRMATGGPGKWREIPGVASRMGDRLHICPPESPPPFGSLPNRSLQQIGFLKGFAPECYRVSIEASRGCSHACNFCSIAACQDMAGDLGGRRLRDPQAIAKEIGTIVRDYGLRDFWFMDADFLGPLSESEHVLSVARAIAGLKQDITLEVDARADAVTPVLVKELRKAGLERCFLGIESFDDRTLRRLGKASSEKSNLRAVRILEEHGVRPILGMIMFHPMSTREQLRHDHARLRSIGYEKTQMLFRLKKYRGSKDAKQTDSDGKGVAPWADYGWEFDNPEIAEIWSAFDALRLKALDEVFIELTAQMRAGLITSSEFMRRSDAIFNSFGEDVDAILG